MENQRKLNNSSRKSKFSKFASILATTLFLINPNGANAQNTTNQDKTQAEISTTTILDRLNQKIGVTLPDEYKEKILDFVMNNTIMKTKNAIDYTENFIVNKMQEDRGISKTNQLLFIWSGAYEKILNKPLYDMLDDEDDNRYDEYSKASQLIDTCGKEYETGFRTYMEMCISEADKRISEADEKGTEATYGTLDEMVRFYNNYKKNPNNIKPEEIQQAKALAKRVINNCNYYKIDYKLKLTKEIREFYGVE